MSIESIQSLSSMKIDMDKIYAIQEQFGPLLAQIDSLKPNYTIPEKGEKLYLAIHDRMRKYGARLSEEFKLRKDKDREAMYLKVLGDIANHTYMLLAKQDRITQEDINILHTKLYPKGLWGETLSPSGKWYLKQYPTGQYRQKRELTRDNEGQEHDYPDFENIPELVDIINDFFYDESYSLHILIKILLYCVYAVGVHPFYNGNGTVYVILLSILLLKNGYAIPEDLGVYIKAITPDILMRAVYGEDYEPLIRGFLELFVEETTPKDT